MTTRVVFAGSPALAVPHLVGLVDAGFTVVAVISREDSPVGRKRLITPTPVAREAERLGIPVVRANSLADVALPDADIGVVVAYGGLVPRRLLDAPRQGWINVHFSELPEYRGAAPLQRALWDGRDATGISVFQLVEELDAGPVYRSRRVPFLPDETASAALDRVSLLAVPDLLDTVREIADGRANAREQIGSASLAPRFTRGDGRIDWARDARTILHRIRAVTSEPGAFTMWGDNLLGVVEARHGVGAVTSPGVVSFELGRVLVGTASEAVELVRVRPAGRGMMSAADWFRGLRDEVHFE